MGNNSLEITQVANEIRMLNAKLDKLIEAINNLKD